MNGVELMIRGAAIGIGASVVMDGAGVLRQGWGGLNGFYRLVGRWIRSVPARGLLHDDIRRTPPVAGEAAIGWAAHFALGAGFGVGFVTLFGESALTAPVVWQGLGFGLGTVLVPWLVFQPLYGWGIAAARLPASGAARRRSAVTHGIFGLGLWLCVGVMSIFEI